MISIINSTFSSHSLVQLREWFESEWGIFEPFSNKKSDIVLPGPILAFSDDKLVGGLSFTAYGNPEKEEQALWINALYVEPQSRGLGIAIKLIDAAEKVAIEYEHSELFVYTTFPELYQKSGWQILQTTGNYFVLKKVLLF
jgi:GNAT superfamily N-acetyltransferase